jgi:hypothetical protein
MQKTQLKIGFTRYLGLLLTLLDQESYISIYWSFWLIIFYLYGNGGEMMEGGGQGRSLGGIGRTI